MSSAAENIGPPSFPPAVSAHPLRELLTLAVPLTANSLSAAAMLFVDGFMVSGLGTDAIAAVLPVHLLFWLIWSIPSGVSGAAGIFSAQAIGKADHNEAVRYTWQGIWISLASVLIAVLAQINAGPLLVLITPSLHGAPISASLFDPSSMDMNVNGLMHSYFNWRNWALPFIAIQGPIFAYFSALRRPWLPVVVAGFAYVLNIVGNYVLIYGKLGVPALGVTGSAISSLLATTLQAAVMLWFFMREAKHASRALVSRDAQRSADPAALPSESQLPSVSRRLAAAGARPTGDHSDQRPLISLARPDLPRLRRLIDIGFPAGCNAFLDIVGWMLIMTVFVKQFGAEALAATNIVTEYMRLSFMPMFGIAGAAATIIGTVIGAGQPQLAVRRARLALAITAGYMGTCGLLMILLRHPLIALFNSHGDPAVAAAGAWMMVMAGLFQALDACNVTYSSACRGAGDTKFPMRLVASASLFSILLGGYLTYYQPQLGSFGPWLAGSLYVIILGLAFAWRFESRRWQGIDIFRR